jgi:hypothetical protein
MPGVRIDGGDHPVFGYLPANPPPAVGAVTALARLHVLAGDQRQ